MIKDKLKVWTFQTTNTNSNNIAILQNTLNSLLNCCPASKDIHSFMNFIEVYYLSRAF